MPKCAYCGSLYDVPHGMTYVKIDGSVTYLCSSKCKKSMFLKKRKVRWVTKTKKVVDEKELAKAELSSEEATTTK